MSVGVGTAFSLDERLMLRTSPTAPHVPDRPEIWAGVECTVNRVGDRFSDQLARGGHAERDDDLDRLAALGVTALRYPVLWERTADVDCESLDWSWADRRLPRIRELGVQPIVGLVHHGSGPRGTSLVDPRFPERLARYAGAVAERFPWVERWTPVNEPLTTARFAGLYGHWYPHGRDPNTFSKALISQVLGIRAAMRAIRAVNPAAKLIQTEDLGKTHGTAALAQQVWFDNERRWVSYDLLTGQLAPGDPMWTYLHDAGIDERVLHDLRDDPCPPDIIGLNYYVTSERFIDPRLNRYPAYAHGGTDWARYADVEAVRVRIRGCDGPAVLLAEAGARYGRPLAITEAHLGCTREQQLRWLAHVWDAACCVRDAGVDVRAVTAWSAFGAHDWASLLTREDGVYETGLFDTRGPVPRPTALATMVRALAERGTHDHPALDGRGWWDEPRRFAHPPARGWTPEPVLTPALRRAVRRNTARRTRRAASGEPRPVLVTGGSGTLGRAVARLCTERGLAHRVTTRAELDVADARAVDEWLTAWNPWAVVNTAGFVRVDDAERERDACYRENVCGPAVLAAACARRDIQLVTFSSDLVFDGALDRPYVEDDAPCPLNVYGATKAEAEARVLNALPSALVVRTSAFFGPWDEWNFATLARRELSAGRRFRALSDVTVSATYVPHLAHTVLDLAIDGAGGIWHLANAGAFTWAALARRVAERAGLDPDLVVDVPVREFGLAAARPQRVVLGSARGQLLGPTENAICEYLAARPAETP